MATDKILEDFLKEKHNEWNKEITAVLREPLKKIIAEIKSFPEFASKRLRESPQKEEEEEEKEEAQEEEQPKQKKTKTKNTDTDWTCAGMIWETPPKPCPKGEKSEIKDGIMHVTEPNGKAKRVIMCRGCKLKRKAHLKKQTKTN